MPNPVRKRTLVLSKVYGFLEPGPVLLLTTSHQGVANVMTLSWHTMLEFDPPLVGCIFSENDFSFAALIATRQCALNIPTVELAALVVGCCNTSGAKVDKFSRFGLTQAPASLIAASLISECYAKLECRVVDMRLENRYNFFVLEVVKAWIAPSVKAPRTLHHRGYGLFMVAGATLKLMSRMRSSGGSGARGRHGPPRGARACASASGGCRWPPAGRSKSMQPVCRLGTPPNRPKMPSRAGSHVLT